MGSKVSKLLEEAQKNHSKEINLKDTNLKHLPMVVCTNFNYITKLNLSDNHIKEIPPDIYKLRSLKIFWILNNKLTVVVDEIGLLSELEDFQADGNQIGKINKVFFELKKIGDLSLSRNNLKEIPPDLGVLTSLRTLSLEHNQLTALPGSLSGLSSLKTLNASNNEIEYIFADFVNLSALTTLSLFSNRLTALPDSFGRLKTLVNLNLRSNKLASLPNSFGSLESLTNLSLWDNNFTVFPESLTQCRSLTELSFSNNRLTDIPPTIHRLKNLRKLYLQYNEIEKMPVEIKYLQQLNHLLLHHNKLTNIPCELSLLKQLDSINLTGNPLPQRLLQTDISGILKHFHCELIHRREICARVIQRHYRAWKKQYRFRSVVLMLMERRNQEKSLSMASKSAEMHRAAIAIQRWYRSRRCRRTWYMLVSKVLLLLSTADGGKRSIGGMTSGGRFGSIFGFDEPDHDGNIIYYTPDGANGPIIKYATIAKLVEHLTYTTYSESNFSKIFFATYTSFISPTELFQLLCVRYHAEPPIHANATDLSLFRKTVKPRIQEKVIEMMGYWIKHHLNDFEVNSKLLQNFNSFLTNTLMFEKETSAKRLIAIFNETKKKNRDDMEELIKFASNAPKPILPLKPLDGASFTILDLSPIEVARQMALIDQTLLSRISAKELLSKKWSSQHVNNQEICPNVLNMINVFNNGSKWISSEIVIEKSSKYRLKKLKFFLDVARLCYEMNNFNGVFQIVSGLSSSSVSRLKGTWGALSSRRREQFDEMERFVNMEGNFKLYRIVLAEAKGPCIPFVGLYLMDLTFMDEGNPSFNNNLLNFVKKRLEANSVNKFLTYKQLPYCFDPVSFIQDILLNSSVLSETELYEKSVAIEKRHLRKISKRQDRERQLTTSTSNSDLSELANSSNTNNTSISSSSSTPKKSKSGRHHHSRRHRDKDSDSPRGLKKGDPANTSSPAIMTSPNKVPTLDFNISASNLSPSPINSLYYSVDNTPAGSPRFTPTIITGPPTPDKTSISNFNPILAFENFAFSLSPKSPRSSRPSSPNSSRPPSRPSSPRPDSPRNNLDHQLSPYKQPQ